MANIVIAVYVIAWLIMMVDVLINGDIEHGSPLRWFCVIVIFGCAFCAMFSIGIGAGVTMIASLAGLAVQKKGPS